jgi:hypothetical protein
LYLACSVGILLVIYILIFYFYLLKLLIFRIVKVSCRGKWKFLIPVVLAIAILIYAFYAFIRLFNLNFFALFFTWVIKFLFLYSLNTCLFIKCQIIKLWISILSLIWNILIWSSNLYIVIIKLVIS